jgi:adenosylhomocysteine nucleosidase
MIAFVAAEAFELAPLEARRTTQDWLCVHAGPGFRLATEAAERAAAHRPAALVSVGLCGALRRDFQAGEIVVADDGGLPRSGRPFRRGRMVSQDRVAITRAEKETLAAQGDAVEMESAAVRAVAARHAIPFYAVKVVSDAAEETLPLDFNLYRDRDGRFRKPRIALAVLARPWLLPDLLRFQRQANLAAAKLGEFLADCEF